jgi:two-component system competent response regulator ComA
VIQLLLVDDHPSVREGTKFMIEENSEYKVTMASSSKEALKFIQNDQFDLFIFDLFMPDYSGIDLTREVISTNEDAIVLIMTGFDLEPHFNVLMEAGVSGFISKTASKNELITAINCALRKQAVLPLSLLKQLRRSEFVICTEGAKKHTISLNEKEMQVLVEAATGKSNKEIAQKLLMSQRMIEYHLTKIFTSLKVNSRVEAIAKAREMKLLPSELLIK